MPLSLAKFIINSGKKLLLIAGFIGGVLPSIFAVERPEYRFDNWTTDDGLPQISVNSILQTRDGFLWISTFGGLVRYDGLRFEVFNTGNTKDLKTSRFLSLFEDKDENLWVNSEGQGVTKYKNGEFKTLTTEQGLPGNLVERMDADADGNFLLRAENQTFRWNGKNFTSYAPEGGKPIKNILQWKDNGDIWFSDGDKLKKIENNRVTTEITPGVVVRRLFEDSNKRLWIASENNSLLMLANGKLKKYDERDGYPDFTYDVIFEDDQKNLWFGTRGGGLLLFKDEKFVSYTTADGLAGNNISSIFQDREKTFWIGTTSGLSRMRKQAVTSYSVEDGLAADNIYPIYQDRQGKIWLGSWRGLTVYQNGSFEDVSRKFSVVNSEVMSLLEDREGNLWVGTWGDGIRIIRNNGSVSVFPADELPGTRIRSIYQDHEGNIWFGTTGGLIKTRSSDFNPADAKSFAVYNESSGFTNKEILSIFEDRRNTMWIGTEAGLFTYENSVFTRIDEASGFAGGIVRSINEDADGDLWIGMYDSGIYRIRDGRFTHYTTNEGLFDNGAFQILEDDAGNFWISSNVGIYRVKKSDLNDFAEGKINRITSNLYNKRDGMLNSECNGGGQPAGIRAADGRLWFPTQKGAAVIDPKTFALNMMPPPVVIEAFTVDGKPAESLAPVEIQADQNYLEIHYSGLSFIQPEFVKFKYKLDGLDEDWTDAGNRRTAYFSHLPPGQYTFRVLAANRDGVWNEQGASFPIKVLPHVWQTLWFKILATLLVAAIILLLYRIRIGVLQKGNAAKEAFARQLIESQENERRRIAAELHDSLGQSLILIKNWALLGLQTKKSQAQMRSNFDEISGTASDAIKEVREIAYNLGPHQLERLGLRKTILEMIEKIGDSAPIDFQTEIDDVDDCLKREAQTSIFRIVQEAASNIIRHSGASRAKLTVRKIGGQVVLIIQDNGKGFAQNAPNKIGGFGLLGMAERVNLLNGEFVIKSEVGKGTTIRVVLPC